MKWKFSHKITLIYVSLMLCALGIVVAITTYWFCDNTDRMYYSYLEDRANEIGRQDLHRFNGSGAYDAYVRNREYAVGRPVFNQIVLDADSKDKMQQMANQRMLDQMLSADEQQTLHKEKMVHFRNQENLGVGVYCPKEEGDFIVIVTLNEHLGDFLQNRLAYWLIAIILLFVVSIILIGKLYMERYISRMDEALVRERQFVHHASHELNNPLTAIQGECEITLIRPRSNQEYVEALDRIGTEAERMNQIIHQLLLLSSAMEGKRDEGEECISWSDFLRQFADGERVIVKVETDKPQTIMANPYLLRMAMQNIVRNALKYSSGQVIIKLGSRHVCVADHGIGIPKSEIPLILQPFYRASNTHAHQGNGIGMSLSAQIFNLYGIGMEVRSRENVGTMVVLKIMNGG